MFLQNNFASSNNLNYLLLKVVMKKIKEPTGQNTWKYQILFHEKSSEQDFSII